VSDEWQRLARCVDGHFLKPTAVESLLSEDEQPNIVEIDASCSVNDATALAIRHRRSRPRSPAGEIDRLPTLGAGKTYQDCADRWQWRSYTKAAERPAVIIGTDQAF